MQTTSTSELQDMAKKLGLGVEICSKKTIPASKAKNFIINLDDKEGSHWCGLKIKPNKVVYFDPFGMIPPSEVQRFMLKTKKEPLYTTDVIQDLDSHACGQFCLMFLKEMEKKTVFEFLVQFTSDTSENERILREWMEEHLPSLSGGGKGGADRYFGFSFNGRPGRDAPTWVFNANTALGLANDRDYQELFQLLCTYDINIDAQLPQEFFQWCAQQDPNLLAELIGGDLDGAGTYMDKLFESIRGRQRPGDIFNEGVAYELIRKADWPNLFNLLTRYDINIDDELPDEFKRYVRGKRIQESGHKLTLLQRLKY